MRLYILACSVLLRHMRTWFTAKYQSRVFFRVSLSQSREVHAVRVQIGRFFTPPYIVRQNCPISSVRLPRPDYLLSVSCVGLGTRMQLVVRRSWQQL